jgi:hypothetical protein
MNSLLNQSNNMVGALKALQNNPIQFLLQQNLNVPNNIGNNPQAIVQYLVNSGQVSQQQVNQAKQMLGL